MLLQSSVSQMLKLSSTDDITNKTATDKTAHKNYSNMPNFE